MSYRNKKDPTDIQMKDLTRATYYTLVINLYLSLVSPDFEGFR